MAEVTFDDRDRALTVRQAAEILYSTKHPSSLQIRRVEERLECGAIAGRKSAQRRWTTTAACIADYMAGQTYRRQLGRRYAPRGGNASHARAARESEPKSPDQDAPLRSVYQEVLKQYFLALIFRRRARHATKAFCRAVLAGQVGLLLLMVLLLSTCLRPLGRALQAPPAEHAAVQRWLAEHEQRFSITRWYPAVQSPDEEGVSLRVEYAYTSGRNETVETDRTFLIKHGRVVSESSSP